MLHFDLDVEGMRQLSDDLGASSRQVRYAINTALGRTATTLRTMAARGLRSELELRTISLLRKRLKTLRFRFNTGADVQLWFGLNDMPVSWFKGRPRETKNGAEFRGKQFPGAFVAKSKFKGRLTVLQRTGRSRLHIVEQTMEIENKSQAFIEDRIFSETDTIFWRYFERDLRARVRYLVGQQ